MNQANAYLQYDMSNIWLPYIGWVDK